MSSPLQIDALLAGIIDPNTALPAAGGTVYFYAPGTTTPKNVWTEAAKTNAYTSYLLNAAGAAHLYADGEYDIVVKNSSGSTIYTWPGLKFKYPGYGVRVVAASTTTTADDDYIVVSGNTATLQITLLAPASWEAKPLTILNSSAYNITVYSSYGINGSTSALTIRSYSAAITIMCTGSTFYLAKNADNMITASGGRALISGDNGPYDSHAGWASAYAVLGHGTYAVRLISTPVTVRYYAASQISVEVSDSTMYGFAPAPNLTASGLAVGGTVNGITLSADGSILSLPNTILYPVTADTAYFVGVISSTACNYAKTAAGNPAFWAYRNSSSDTSNILYLRFYLDGAVASLVTALSTSGNYINIDLVYAMRPYSA